MKHPTTLSGWIGALAGAFAILATLSGGATWFVRSNAWASDMVHMASAVKTLRCDILNQQIQQLELKQAEGGLTPREQAWLQDLLRQWDKHCSEDT